MPCCLACSHDTLMPSILIWDVGGARVREVGWHLAMLQGVSLESCIRFFVSDGISLEYHALPWNAILPGLENE